MPRLPHPSAPPPPASGTRGPISQAPLWWPRADRWLEGWSPSYFMGLRHRGRGMLRAGLGGGWTQGSADQTARLYNLQPLSLDWNGAEGSPSISPPGGCSLPTGLLDLRFYLFGPSPPPSLCCLCFILILLLEGVASTPSPIAVPLPGGIESTQSLEAGPGPALMSHVSFRKRGVRVGRGGQKPSVSPCASHLPFPGAK